MYIVHIQSIFIALKTVLVLYRSERPFNFVLWDIIGFRNNFALLEF
jgi:hypothetical protein